MVAAVGGRRVWIVAAVVLLAVFFALSCNFVLLRVRGLSMAPTLCDSDWLLVKRVVGGDARQVLRRGDIVVFAQGAGASVKRVYALPGDTVSFKGADLWRNGRRSDAGRCYGVDADAGGVAQPGRRYLHVRVSDGRVFLVGDNRYRSDDSRSIGLVEARDVIGFVTSVPLRAEGHCSCPKLGNPL